MIAREIGNKAILTTTTTMKNQNYPPHHHQENLHEWTRTEKEKETMEMETEIEIAQIAHVGIMIDMEDQGIQTIRIHIRTRILTVAGLY